MPEAQPPSPEPKKTSSAAVIFGIVAVGLVIIASALALNLRNVTGSLSTDSGRIDRLQADNERMQALLDAAKTSAAEWESKVGRAELDSDHWQKELRRLQGQLDESTATSAQMRTELKTFRADSAQMRMDLDRISMRSSDAEARLARTQEDMARLLKEADAGAKAAPPPAAAGR